MKEQNLEKSLGGGSGGESSSIDGNSLSNLHGI